MHKQTKILIVELIIIVILLAILLLPKLLKTNDSVYKLEYNEYEHSVPEITKEVIQEEDIVPDDLPDITAEDESFDYTTNISEVNEWEQYHYFTKFMDLNTRTYIATEDMKALIEYWCKNHQDSFLLGNEQAFINASNETGLDPIFLLALAGLESGWGESKIHKEYNNPYSINMVDKDIENGFRYSSTYEGIYNGAKWIYDNYYSQGQKTLNDMIYGKKMYASSKDEWIDTLCKIITSSYKYLDEMNT